MFNGLSKFREHTVVHQCQVLYVTGEPALLRFFACKARRYSFGELKIGVLSKKQVKS